MKATAAKSSALTALKSVPFGKYCRSARAILTPRHNAPLLLLLGASVLPDVVDIVYAVAGVRSPFGLYSHSLPAITVLAFVAGAVAIALTGRRGVAVAVVAVVALHAPADWITGEKVLWAGGPVTHLNLYRWPWADFLLEVPIVVLGWLALRRSGAGPKWATGRNALISLIVFQAGLDSSLTITLLLGTKMHRVACERTSEH